MKTLMIAMASLLLAACAGVPVSTDYAPGVNFSGLQSYAWLPQAKQAPSKDPEADNDLVRQRIVSAVESQLQARGFSRASSPDAADMLITYHNGLEDKIRIDSNNFGAWHTRFGYYPCYHCFHRPGFGFYGDPYFFHNDIQVRNYTENTLIVDIIDPESRSLIWRGMSKRTQPSLSTPEERRLYVVETVAAILAEFPPGYAAASAQ